jgi:hypothetical protein
MEPLDIPSYLDFGCYSIIYVWFRNLAGIRALGLIENGCSDRVCPQVQRLQWKNDLVRQAEEQLAKDAVVLPSHIESVSSFLMASNDVLTSSLTA